MTSDREKDPLTFDVIGCAMKVQGFLGNGLLESAYETFLAHELVKNGFAVVRQPALPVNYDGIRIDLGYRPDLIVNSALIVEGKAVSKLDPVHEAQILTYMRLSGIKKGLLINFHAVPFKSGIRRFVLSHEAQTSSA